MSLPELGPIKFQVATASGTTISKTTAASSITMMTTNQQFWHLAVFNSCSLGIGIALNQVEAFRINQNGLTVLQLSDSGIFIPKGTVISVYNLGATPAVGEVSVTAMGRDMSNYG